MIETIFIFALAALISVFGCSQTEVNQPVSSKVSKSAETPESSVKELDSSESSADASVSKKFNTGGLPLGSESMQEALKKCHEKIKYFDRAKEECVESAELFQGDCTKEAISAKLEEKQKKNFDDLLSGETLKDYKIDQCVACPKSSSNDICKSKSGAKQDGLKIFFAKDDAGEIKIQSLNIPSVKVD